MRTILMTLVAAAALARAGEPTFPCLDAAAVLADAAKLSASNYPDADIILVNYCKNSIGTSMEVFYASHNLKKFVVAFSPFSYQDSSPWMIRFCTKILPDLESACRYIKSHFIELHHAG